MTSKETMIIHPDDLKGNPNNRSMYDGLVLMGIEEAMSGPLMINGKAIGSLHLHSKSAGHFTERMQSLFKGICDLLAIGVSNLLAKEEIEKLNSQLQEEKEYLMEEVNYNYNYEEMIGASQSMRDVYKLTSQVAVTDSTVLILGETGTGKELFARAIHNLSNRKDKPLIKINCAALPKELVESELFGHEKGSFTGALKQKIGKFELAQFGTIFFDEIGELPHEMQSKLLRVLQEREFERVGGNQTIQSDVRIIAATNRNLENSVNNGEFRADLFYRLNVFSINLPPLSERKEDIPLLTNHFLIKYAQRVGKNIKSISQQSLKELEVYPWPGNVRELEHVIERSVILSTGSVLKVHLDKKLLKSSESNAEFKVKTLQESERELILNTLKICSGRIRGEGGASELLDIKPSTLEFRMKKLGITRGHVLVA
jgi:formate hydrogenlyase transcriptional activator